jgi:hypothetical protein
MQRIGVPALQRHRSWTTLEQARLKALWRDPTLSTKKIAAQIGREPKAVSDRARAMGLPSRAPAKWTAGQRQIVQQIVDEQISLLARRFGRSPAAVAPIMVRTLMKFNRRTRMRIFEKKLQSA